MNLHRATVRLLVWPQFLCLNLSVRKAADTSGPENTGTVSSLVPKVMTTHWMLFRWSGAEQNLGSFWTSLKDAQDQLLEFLETNFEGWTVA